MPKVVAPGYVTQTATVTVTAQQGVTQDFDLLMDASWVHRSYLPLVMNNHNDEEISRSAVPASQRLAALPIVVPSITLTRVGVIVGVRWARQKRE